MAKLIETGSQPYGNCILSGGIVQGHDVDTIYIKLDRPPEEAMTIMFRRDEVLAVMWLLAGALWAEEIEHIKS